MLINLQIKKKYFSETTLLHENSPSDFLMLQDRVKLKPYKCDKNLKHSTTVCKLTKMILIVRSVADRWQHDTKYKNEVIV